MHKLLLRQLKRYVGADAAIPQEWQHFITAVNEAYYQAEDDLALLECSMDLASQELLDRNQQLQKAKEAAEEGQRLVERLSRVAIAMQTAQEQEDRLQIFRQAAYEVMSFDRLYILLASPDGSHFELRAMHGQESADLPERLPLSTAAGPILPGLPVSDIL